MRHWFVAAAVALAVAVAAQAPPLARFDGFSIDALFWLRHHLYGPGRAAADSPTVVIAIDEETYRRPPFQGLPKAMWTPQIAGVLEAVLDSGALVIGQDLILPTSVERFVQGYDRDYLLVLRKGAQEGRLVLGKVQHLRKPLSPFPGYSFAVGHQRNIRLVNLFRDGDGVIRRVPLVFRGMDPDGEVRLEASMALELAARALGEPLDLGPPGRAVDLGGYLVPGSEANAMLLNFETGTGDIPTFSLADLHACVRDGASDFFTKHFAGKVVLLGGVLDLEDRKLTSKRFATGPELDPTFARCRLPAMEGLYDERVVRDSIPGVYVLATAVNNLLRRDVLRELPTALQLGTVFLLALAAGGLGLSFRPGVVALLVGAGLADWVLVAVIVFDQGLVLPLVDPAAAALATFAVVVGYRFAVTDREKRAVRRAFSYYLPEAVIERMLARGAVPKLGGETREVTVVFSDLADFTAHSEDLAPAEVVDVMNRYLSAMTDIIEGHGGFIDKYIGDAILAVFGAPLDDPDHARHGVEAALACQARLAEIGPDLGLPGGHSLAARIGIASGPVLIGNIGSRRRFNYTVMGDVVNLAARLEGANRLYGTPILMSGETAAHAGPETACREIDRVRVVGRTQPVALFQPLAGTDNLSGEQGRALARFAEALQALRARDFAAAAGHFEALASEDPVAARMAQWARELARDPPPPDWDGVRDLDVK